jgi:hypothetical protein
MVGGEMNNEPVAWMNPKSLECGYGGDVDWEDTGCIPLYTHPIKELTDEEIAEIAMQCSDMDGYGHSQLKEYDFARAILRKVK